MLAIRMVTIGDIKNINEMLIKSWPLWVNKNKTNAIRHIKNRVKNRNIFVCVLNDKIIGYIVFGIIWSHIHLEGIFVEKGFRRQGIGTSLIEKIEEYAKKNGYKKILSDCDSDNLASIKFHKKLGFKKSGYIKKLWGNKDSYIFFKEF